MKQSKAVLRGFVYFPINTSPVGLGFLLWLCGDCQGPFLPVRSEGGRGLGRGASASISMCAPLLEIKLVTLLVSNNVPRERWWWGRWGTKPWAVPD